MVHFGNEPVPNLKSYFEGKLLLKCASFVYFLNTSIQADVHFVKFRLIHIMTINFKIHRFEVKRQCPFQWTIPQIPQHMAMTRPNTFSYELITPFRLPQNTATYFCGKPKEDTWRLFMWEVFPKDSKSENHCGKLMCTGSHYQILKTSWSRLANLDTQYAENIPTFRQYTEICRTSECTKEKIWGASWFQV